MHQDGVLLRTHKVDRRVADDLGIVDHVDLSAGFYLQAAPGGNDQVSVQGPFAFGNRDNIGFRRLLYKVKGSVVGVSYDRVPGVGRAIFVSPGKNQDRFAGIIQPQEVVGYLQFLQQGIRPGDSRRNLKGEGLDVLSGYRMPGIEDDGLLGIEVEGVAPAEMFDLNGQVLGVAYLNIEFVIFLLAEIGNDMVLIRRQSRLDVLLVLVQEVSRQVVERPISIHLTDDFVKLVAIFGQELIEKLRLADHLGFLEVIALEFEVVEDHLQYLVLLQFVALGADFPGLFQDDRPLIRVIFVHSAPFADDGLGQPGDRVEVEAQVEAVERVPVVHQVGDGKGLGDLFEVQELAEFQVAGQHVLPHPLDHKQLVPGSRALHQLAFLIGVEVFLEFENDAFSEAVVFHQVFVEALFHVEDALGLAVDRHVHKVYPQAHHASFFHELHAQPVGHIPPGVRKQHAEALHSLDGVTTLYLDLKGPLGVVFQVYGHHPGQGDLHVMCDAVDGQFCREFLILLLIGDHTILPGLFAEVLKPEHVFELDVNIYFVQA